MRRGGIPSGSAPPPQPGGLFTTTYDPAVWIPAPPCRRIPSTGAERFERWVTVAGSRFLSPADDPAGPKAAAIGRILRALGSLDYPSWDPFWLHKWIHWPTVRVTPTAVIVSGIPAEDGGSVEELRHFCGVGSPAALEEPLVEEISSPILGPGLRGLVYSAEAADGSKEVHATLSYVWPVKVLDEGEVEAGIVRLWASGTPPQILAAQPDIEALAMTLRMEPVD